MNEDEKQELETIKFLTSVENIDRATSTVIENSVSIFLPFKRIDKTDIYNKVFIPNNQILEIQNDLFDKVEIRGRLLGQGHKDILEVLLSSPKIYSKKEKRFKIKVTAWELTKRLGRNVGKKQWLIQQLKEIAECRINIYFKNTNGDDIDFNFSFIDNIIGINKNELTINFTSSYTYFLAEAELLEYSKYVNDIVMLDKYCKQWSKARDIKSHHINSDFIKAIVRYMLQHKGNNSQIKIDNLLVKLNFKSLISEEQLKNYLTDLKRAEVQEYLKDKFGITLTANEETVCFNTPKNKPHYILNN